MIWKRLNELEKRHKVVELVLDGSPGDCPAALGVEGADCFGSLARLVANDVR